MSYIFIGYLTGWVRFTALVPTTPKGNRNLTCRNIHYKTKNKIKYFQLL